MAKTTKFKEVYESDILGIKGKANSIVFPDSAEEIQNLVKLSQLDIIARGGGTSFTGSLIPNNSVIIDLSKFNKLLNIDTGKRVAYAEAGITINDLNEELERFNLELPIEPLFPSLQTLGGIIATNAAGSREIKYGRILNWIDSLEVVNGRGELVNVHKSDAGDFVGMEGTTGLIIRAKLRLTNKKNRSFSVLKSDSLDEIFKAGKRLKLNQEVSMLELLGKTASKLLGLDEKYHLIVELENEQGNFKESRYKEFLKIKRRVYSAMASAGFVLLEDPRLFVDKLPEFFFYLERENIPYSCNFGSGTVYCSFKKENPEKRKLALEYLKRTRAKISDSLGIGLTKKDYIDAGDLKLIKRIKNRHDPFWKFNRNKFLNIAEKQEQEKKQEVEAEKLEVKAGITEEKKEEVKVEEQKKQEQPAKLEITYEPPQIDDEPIEHKDESTEIKGEQPEQARPEEVSQAEVKEIIQPSGKKEPSEEEKKMISKIAGGFFSQSKPEETEKPEKTEQE